MKRYDIGYLLPGHDFTLSFAKQNLPGLDGWAEYAEGYYHITRPMVVIGYENQHSLEWNRIVFWRPIRDGEGDFKLMSVSDAIDTRFKVVPSKTLLPARTHWDSPIDTPLAWWVTYQKTERDLPVLLYDDESVYTSKSSFDVAIWWENRGKSVFDH